MKLMLALAALLPSLAACAPPYEAPAQAAASASAQTAAAAPNAAKTTPAATAVPVAAVAGDTPEMAALRAKLGKTLDVKNVTLRPSPMPGIYEVQSGMNFGYVTADGEYLIEGDLVRLSTGEQITDKQRSAARLAAVDKIGEQNMIVFAPPKDKIKHTITVFTDVDCGYCRMLHSQVAEYNAKGIAIRYVSFPRTGPNTESFRNAEVVWCSADRKDALTKAKLGDPMKGDSSCKNPVTDEYMTGVSIGVRGTPSLILDDGSMITGYQPPEQLAQVLDTLGKRDAKAAEEAAASTAKQG
ncbi:MAG: thioredoxin fold domain-containing protein [Stenotrophobium sp.]